MTDSIGDQPAFPRQDDVYDHGCTGLTKREHAAIQIMAGFAANHEMNEMDTERLAKLAVEEADALMDELEKPRD